MLLLCSNDQSHPEPTIQPETVIIPAGLKSIPTSFAGKTLGEAAKDEMFVQSILKFLAKKVANASGEKFEPANQEQVNLSSAAATLLAATEAAKDKKAKK